MPPVIHWCEIVRDITNKMQWWRVVLPSFLSSLALRVLVLVEHEVDEEGGADEGGLHADVEVLGEGDGEGAHVGAHLAAALRPLLGDGPHLALAVAPSHLIQVT